MIEPEAVASELRVVLGRIVRRLRAERVQRRGLPLAQVVVLGRLDRGGPSGISALAAAEHMRPQSMAATVAGVWPLPAYVAARFSPNHCGIT